MGLRYRRGSADAARSRATDPATTRAQPAAILVPAETGASVPSLRDRSLGSRWRLSFTSATLGASVPRPHATSPKPAAPTHSARARRRRPMNDLQCDLRLVQQALNLESLVLAFRTEGELPTRERLQRHRHCPRLAGDDDRELILGPCEPGGDRCQLRRLGRGQVNADHPAGGLLDRLAAGRLLGYGDAGCGERDRLAQRPEADAGRGAGGTDRAGAAGSGSAWLQPATASTRPARAAPAPTASPTIAGLISAPGSRAARARRSASGPHPGRRSRPRPPE